MKVRRNVDDSLKRFKALFVAKGYNQRLGIDFGETFSPLVEQLTIRVLLSLTIKHSCPLIQLNVNKAFLHGPLEEHVFMKQIH